MEAAESADADGRGNRHGERVAGLDANIEEPFGELDAEIAADEAAEDCFAVGKPGGAAEEAVPVGEDERQLGTEHRTAKSAEADAELLTRRERQRALRPTREEDADENRGGHDQDCKSDRPLRRKSGRTEHRTEER